jgi:hypothetical protein
MLWNNNMDGRDHRTHNQFPPLSPSQPNPASLSTTFPILLHYFLDKFAGTGGQLRWQHHIFGAISTSHSTFITSCLKPAGWTAGLNGQKSLHYQFQLSGTTRCPTHCPTLTLSSTLFFDVRIVGRTLTSDYHGDFLTCSHIISHLYQYCKNFGFM